MRRSQEVEKLRNLSNPDVLVLGAGINGASVFSQLARTDASVVIIDKTDFGAGASNASSRMAHGGIKYLESGELSVVKEAVISRNELLKRYPHYIEPLKITVPVTTWFGGVICAAIRLFKPSFQVKDRGALLLKIGLLIYDYISRSTRQLPKHGFVSKGKTRQRHPGISGKYRGSFDYFEGAISHPERIAFEMIDEGVRCNGACAALNHCEFIGATPDGVKLQDHQSSEQFVVHPKIVVNATGAWVDQVKARVSGANKDKLIDGTKGSHLILQCQALRDAMNGSGFVWSNADGRLSIMYPLGEHVLLGSTEIRVTSPEDVACDEGEQAYLFAALRALFPELKIDRNDVILRYAGVRPLMVSGQSDPRGATRDHHINITHPGNGQDFYQLDLVGGKWTTFAPFGRDVAKKVCQLLGKTCRPWDPASNNKSLREKDDILPNLAECDLNANLVRRYGQQRGSQISAFCSQSTDTELKHLAGYSKNEISWFIQREAAVSLEDIFFRRTNIVFTEQISYDLISEVAEILATELQLTEKEAQREMSSFVECLRNKNGVPIHETSCPCGASN